MLELLCFHFMLPFDTLEDEVVKVCPLGGGVGEDGEAFLLFGITMK